MKCNTNRSGSWLAALLALVAGHGCAAFGADASAPNRPATGTRITIEMAVALALENSPGILASAARVDAAAGRADQARRWANPELELNAEDWPVSGGGFADAKQTIGIVQTLPFPGRKSLDRRIGLAGVKLSEAELAVRKTELVRDVKAAFFGVLASERMAEVSRELVAVAESSASTAQKRVEAGAAAYQEQLRAEVQLERARTELADSEREVVRARQVLAAIAGRPELKEAALSGTLAEEPEHKLLEAPAPGWVDRHPSLAAARIVAGRSELEHRRARLEPYPDVRIGAAGGRIGETDESIVELGLTLPLPILDRGKGKQREAQANARIAAAEFEKVRQDLERAWALAHARYRAAAEQVAGYRERLLPKASEALGLVRTGFEEGKFGYIDLLDTQRTMAEARLAYQAKLLELSVSRAELEALREPEKIQANDR